MPKSKHVTHIRLRAVWGFFTSDRVYAVNTPAGLKDFHRDFNLFVAKGYTVTCCRVG